MINFTPRPLLEDPYGEVTACGTADAEVSSTFRSVCFR